MTSRWTLWTGLVTLLAASPGSSQEVVGVADPPLVPYIVIEGRQEPEQSLKSAMKSSGVRAISYASIVDGRIAEIRHVGAEVENVAGVPRFQAASISKPVAALGILRLAERHGLDIDADVNDYLSGWKVDYGEFDEGPRVTIRRLLSHRAGLNVHGFPGYEPTGEIPSTRGVLEGTGNTDRIAMFQEPGKGFSYSGGGYTVLQLLVEEQTGESFGDYMAREVLEPLGMSDSHFEDTPGGPHPVAKDSQGQAYEVPYHVYPEKAAAALWTTAPDLARFLIAADAIVAGERPDILSAELASQWLEVPEGEGEESYALGFGVVDDGTHEVFQHTGSNFGYKSIMYFDRASKTGFAALADADRGYALNSMLARGHSRANGLNFMLQRVLVPVAQSAEQWALIEGDWIFPEGPMEGRTFRFSRTGEADMLAVEIATGEESRLLAIGPMEFIDVETTSPLVFETNVDGELEPVFAGSLRMKRAD